VTDAKKEIKIELGPAALPAVNRMLTTPPFPDGAVPPHHLTPLMWVVDDGHPTMNGATIKRMFLAAEGVEVYSTTSTPKGDLGVRNMVPWHMVRMTEEIMDLRTFVEEIQDQEKDAPAGEEEVPAPNGAASAASS
jgi:hypothetical protein